MEPVRVGVIGVGHLGFHHARVYTELLNTDVVGIMDTNPERAAAVGELLRVPFYSDIEQFYRQARPDAVSVVVPTVQHFESAKRALSAGIHVLIEKPVTSTVEEAVELLQQAAAQNLVLQVGHIERFNSAVQHVRNIIKEPLFLQSRRIGPFSSRISDVGVVLDLMIHDIDIILSLVHSEISAISAMGRSVRSSLEDIATAQIAFENGTLAQILVSRVSERRLRQLEIMEPERFVTVNYETQDVSIHRCVQEKECGLVEVIEHPVFPKREPLKLELQHFVTCVREGKQPLVGIMDGKRALEVAISILKQIQAPAQMVESTAGTA
ncbi:MAG: Inositol 2-dehydrogenase/D-chiro-inositol 3-dehydrogenase [Synergistetes bacterium ADurb.Bin155]|jgi:predicted dehydrogenase|nr:Gfo/Idh/MocA family oxidoreductase [Synergistales bacterium]NMD17746.1 Gfo/Idh/MocA family oxidoreductase [Synergistaceae bacterium]OQB47339.1 MAG: Inositol 2-dehydrogenase/D-chiro-inositol 3-dehydrogenase [Synergistetes bacterium ADurb.Bin155]MBP8995127.1 Gfo/Idh/MocA family oxidoreductase [Synergistales bacterium]HOC81917.1 Gfo/Idh/MocA family oxidoreductase [Synergistales bacterium]